MCRQDAPVYKPYLNKLTSKVVSKGQSHRDMYKNTNYNNKGVFDSSVIKSKINKANKSTKLMKEIYINIKIIY